MGEIMKNIICPECNTENEPQYKYCKNCGKQLVAEKGNNTFEGENTYEPREAYYGAKTVVDNIAAVSVEDIEAYVGKKSYKIIPKFSKMELTGSKISWCWPVAILSYLFGPLGAAIWFFYRKMYKTALIFAAIGVALTIGLSFLSGDAASIEEGVTAQLEAGVLDFNKILSADTPQTVKAMLFGFVSNIVNLATTVFCGLFSYRIYKNDVIDKILKYKRRDVDPRYYRMGLAAIGGTSVGMAILGIIIMCFTEELCAFITALVL